MVSGTSQKSVDPRPEWSQQPFRGFLTYLQTETGLVHLAMSGIARLVHGEKLAEALHGVADLMAWDPEESEKQLAAAKSEAALAKAEVDADFPLLHAHSLMAIWGALENLVTDVVRTWLHHRPSLMKHGPMASIKVPLGQFVTMSKAERIEHVLASVPTSLGVTGGYPRLESLLALVNLGGSVPEQTKKSLIEAYQVRNLYAHRAGIVDSRALQVCPWRTDWTTGQLVRVTHQQWSEYLGAVHDYVLELIYRSAAQFGPDVRVRVEAQVHASMQDLGDSSSTIPLEQADT